MRNEGGLGQGRSSGGGEEWLGSEHTLKVKPGRFGENLDMGCE